ncbi:MULTISPECIES: hypothetical protein [unclassified Streptomyces]|uniref:hypothetical protein n=1 Tax=unclassified Streptomyces TaxID=2593676 RepID=UPI0035E1F880
MPHPTPATSSIDPIDDLTDTLYDALYDITPYAEPDFADETEGLKNAVRAVLAEAAAQQWIQKQLDETGIRSTDFRNGMQMELEPARQLLAHQVAAARAMLGDAPNYTETKVEYDVKLAESPELYTIVIQRHAPGALTPHEARQKAEARAAELEEALSQIRHLHKDSPMGPCPTCFDGDDYAAGGDGLVSYPCPTVRLADEALAVARPTGVPSR